MFSILLLSNTVGIKTLPDPFLFFPAAPAIGVPLAHFFVILNYNTSHVLV